MKMLHVSHDMLPGFWQPGAPGIHYFESYCDKCEHAVWGNKYSWNTDSQLYSRCTGRRNERLLALSAQERAKAHQP